jgi:hypothetical protein
MNRGRIVAFPSLGTTREPERRSTLRFSFDASADVVEEAAGKRIVVRVSEIALHGCLRWPILFRTGPPWW